ncbi:MAG: hypothetical protein IKN12_12550 [Selenomonadaceae bacterium]|nr:hypothetical protein [Selenomonadaceae bacterium]
MLELQAYYDGATFRPLEKVTLQKNQTVVITVLENFANEKNQNKKESHEEKERLSGSLHKFARPKISEKERIKKIKGLRGCLSDYAIKDGRSIEDIMELESKAWEQAVVEKYGNA